MANTKVRITERVGDPRSGVIIQPGAVVDLPEAWAARYIRQGKAELVTVAAKAAKTKKKPDAESQ